MKLIVDANILFAALIKEGSTAELLISDKLQLFAPEFLFIEFAKYEELILKKTRRSPDEFKEFIEFIELLKMQITIISKKDITPFIAEADKISPDPKDTIYLALALALKASVWSNDKRLKQGQDKILVLSTEEVIEKTNIIF